MEPRAPPKAGLATQPAALPCPPARLQEWVEVEEQQLVHAHGARNHVEHGQPRLKPLVPALQPLEQLLRKALRR